MTVLADTLSPLSRLRRLRQHHPYKLMMVGAVMLYVVISHMMLTADEAGPVQVRIDLSPLLRIPAVLQAHIAGAVLSFVIGTVLLLGVKGRTFHRVLGYTWIAAMTVTAISSFWLTGINGNSYSFIHLLSGWTVIVLPMGLAAARRHNIALHRKEMTGIFMGGMLVAGLFSFLPGRLMWHLFFTA
ncbi:MAG TPA: DUF2306 domain-containing protein [Hyphomonas sp.]|nr:DUF2306 domain-containing protein [Hyphomonas sp.]